MYDIWTVDNEPPSIDEVRPGCCPRCLTIAIREGAIVLHGHGLRDRAVVLPPAPHKHTAQLVRIWVRRFRCTACKATCTVLPPGVLPGHLYSLWAIVWAWFLAARPPIGEGKDDGAVYAQQGVDRLTPEQHHYGRPRWRSLARWATRLETWWPSRAVVGSNWRQRTISFLASLHARNGPDWLKHAICGAVM